MNDTYSIGNVRRPAFLSLPERSSKPRDVGLTHVLDKGQTAQSAQSVLITSAPLNLPAGVASPPNALAIK